MLVFRARPRRDPTVLPTLTNSERRMMRVLGEAMREVREQVTQDEGRILDAVMHSSSDRVANLVTVEPWLNAQEYIEDELVREIISAGQRVKLPTLQKATISFRFDAERPEASRWAAKEAGGLIVEIIEDQRTAVKDYVSRAALGEFTPQQVARGLRDTIGLTNQQAGWVENFRQRQMTERLAAGRTMEQAFADTERATQRYHDRIHKYRTETIARTEILRASNEGRKEAWQQGVEEGFIDPSWVKRWSTEQDARTCDECGPLDGETAPVLGDFPWGDPPLHPNCRCTLLLEEPDEPREFTDLTDDELEELINDLMDGNVEDVTPITEPEDDITDIVAEDALPEWAKEAGIDELLAELPEDRSEIGFKTETEEDMIRRFENKHSDYAMDIEEIRAKGADGDEYMELAPALEADLERIDAEFVELMSDGIPAEGTPERERYEELIVSERQIRDELRDAQDAVRIRDKAEAAIASAKERNPNFLNEMTPRRVIDIDTATGAPGETLRAQARVMREVGKRVDDEAMSRLRPELREALSGGEQVAILTGKITEADLREISRVRQAVLAELRPMDQGQENFAIMNAQDAKVLNRITHRDYKVTAGTSSQLQAAHDGLNAFPSSWIETLHSQQGQTQVFESSRGFTTPDMNIIGVSGRDLNVQRAVATHEIGHRMETAIAGLNMMEYAYMYERNRFGAFRNVGPIPNTKNERYIMATSFTMPYTTRLYEKSTDELIGKMTSVSESRKVMFEVFTTGTQAAFPQTKSDTDYGDRDGNFQQWTLGVIASL